MFSNTFFSSLQPLVFLTGTALLTASFELEALPQADVADDAKPSTAAAAQENDFKIIFNGTPFNDQKYLTFGWNGWSGRTVRWRYNDANRPANLVASASATVSRIQAAMGKWSAACNIQFVYEGTTASAASLATSSRDGVNVITWGSLSGNTTGITYVGASGFSGTTFTLDEADVVLNSQFNPSLDATLVHELGHMLGLKHSNQESTVMSGPNTAPDPSTSYTGLATLQADDIAGCQALYGGTAPPSPLPPVAATRQMVEFRYGPLDYYFITSRDAEKTTLDGTAGYARTGASFLVYTQAQISTRPITRFYFDRVAQGASRGSHFYTLLDSDLVTLANQNPTRSTAPGFAQNEGIDSYAVPPLVPGVGGSCLIGLDLAPVYRLFRGGVRFPDNPNHRYTTSTATYNSFVAQGWDGEGVNFCVPTR